MAKMAPDFWFDLANCTYTVKYDAFLGPACGLSLTDVCDVPQGMAESDHKV